MAENLPVQTYEAGIGVWHCHELFDSDGAVYIEPHGVFSIFWRDNDGEKHGIYLKAQLIDWSAGIDPSKQVRV